MTQTDRQGQRPPGRWRIVVGLLILGCVAAGCGHKAPPRPPEKEVLALSPGPHSLPGVSRPGA